VSGATYRIDVTKEPDDLWYARIHRLSDEHYVATECAWSAEEVVSDARKRVASLNTLPDPVSLFVDDDGRDAEEFSVRV